MQLVDKSITLDELKDMSKKMFNQLVKAVVDVEQEIMVVDAEVHADEEYFLLERGSDQGNLWGINLHPFNTGEDFLEFDSVINIRPSWGNRSRSVDDPIMQERIKSIVNKLVRKC